MSEGINPNLEEAEGLNELLSGGEWSVNFEFEWEGFRVPEAVTAPAVKFIERDI